MDSLKDIPQLIRLEPESKFYTAWYAEKLWTLIPSQAIVGQFLQTFRDFPQRQKSAAFNLDRILTQMQALGKD
jgi:hypothetical protein